MSSCSARTRRWKMWPAMPAPFSYEILTGLGTATSEPTSPTIAFLRGHHESHRSRRGIIGVTSAYQLARAGHEVTVIDRQPGPALETSFANAGEVSFGYCSPWAAPGIPMKAMKWLFMQHAPLICGPRWMPR